MMKKTTRKLVLRKETVREFSRQALTRVVGGLDTDAVGQTGYKQCLTSGLISLDVPQNGG